MNSGGEKKGRGEIGCEKQPFSSIFLSCFAPSDPSLLLHVLPRSATVQDTTQQSDLQSLTFGSVHFLSLKHRYLRLILKLERPSWSNAENSLPVGNELVDSPTICQLSPQFTYAMPSWQVAKRNLGQRLLPVLSSLYDSNVPEENTAQKLSFDSLSQI